MPKDNTDATTQPQPMEDVDIEVQADTTPTGEENNQEGEEQPSRLPKIVLGLGLLAFIIFVIFDSITNQYIPDVIEAFLEWVEENPSQGVIVFVLVYFTATVLFIPGSILTLGAGFVFGSAFSIGGGVALGSVAVFFGASFGATASFLLGRYLLRDQALKLTRKYAVFEALDKALADKGFRIFILLRLSPIIPFNAINYIGGVTAVSLRDYVVSLIGILPGTVVYVFLGAGAGSLTDSQSSDDNQTVTFIVLACGAVFGIVSIYLTTRYARNELTKVLEAREAEDKPDDEQEQEQPRDDGETAEVPDVVAQ